MARPKERAPWFEQVGFASGEPFSPEDNTSGGATSRGAGLSGASAWLAPVCLVGIPVFGAFILTIGGDLPLSVGTAEVLGYCTIGTGISLTAPPPDGRGSAVAPAHGFTGGSDLGPSPSPCSDFSSVLPSQRATTSSGPGRSTGGPSALWLPCSSPQASFGSSGSLSAPENIGSASDPSPLRSRVESLPTTPLRAGRFRICGP